MVELIAKDFVAEAKIVFAPSQEDDVGDVEVVAGGHALVLSRVAELKGAQHRSLWNDRLLGIAEAVDSHILIGEGSSGKALAYEARETKSELVDRAR